MKNAHLRALVRTLQQTKSFIAFEKLSRSQKRVLIAKDALAQLNAEAYRSTQGCYVRPANGSCLTANTQLREQLPDIGPCRVCARGALFLSAIRKANNFVLPADATSLVDEDLHEVEDRYWTRKELANIEAAFEGWDEPETKTHRFHIKNGGAANPTGVLRAILKNIIKNNGNFRP